MDNIKFSRLWSSTSKRKGFCYSNKKDEAKAIDLPEPTHHNIENAMTLQQRRFDGYKKCQFFKEPNKANNSLKPWVTVGEALSDLPSFISISEF